MRCTNLSRFEIEARPLQLRELLLNVWASKDYLEKMTEGKCHCPWSHRLCEKTDIHLAFYIIHIIRHSILTFYQAFFLVSIARVRARACPNWAGAPDRVRVRRSPDYRGACERSPVCPAVELAVSFWRFLEQVCFASWHLLWDLGPCPQCKAREWEAAKAWAAEGRSYTFLKFRDPHLAGGEQMNSPQSAADFKPFRLVISNRSDWHTKGS